MIDIIIKSYNRTYLLDRTLHSIYLFAKNKGNVVVLDDGTPDFYLQPLKDKYKDLIIKKSVTHKDDKEHSNPPIQFWKNEIDKCSEYVLVLEDDIWLNKEVDLYELEQFLKSNNVDFFKLKWWGNNTMIRGNFDVATNTHFGILQPNLKPLSELLVKNRFYLHSICNLFKIIPANYFLSLYSIYDVAGQVFSKKFYSFIWPSSQYRIEEMIQLGRAAEYYRMNKNRAVGRTDVEYATTTFCSSSVGSIEKYGFDMNKYNKIWNQSWMNGELNSLSNFPNDFTLSYLEQFIHDDTNISKWKDWSVSWRNHFIALGSDLRKYNNINELKS